MTKPAIQSFLQVTLNRAINAYLALDSASKDRLQNLQNKSFAIILKPMQMKFVLHFSEDGVSIDTDTESIATVTVTATPLQLMNIMLCKSDRDRAFVEDITMEGNAEFAQHVLTLFDELEIDWEDYLAHFVGDVPSYHANRWLKSAKDWLHDARFSLTQNINEYIHEEAQWLPTREALNDLFADIDLLRMDVDRLATKFMLLKNRQNDDLKRPTDEAC